MIRHLPAILTIGLLLSTAPACLRAGFNTQAADTHHRTEAGSLDQGWDGGPGDASATDADANSSTDAAPDDAPGIDQTLPTGVTTFAGTGGAGLANGPVATARFHSPHGVALDGKGRLYISDGDNNVIRMIVGGQVSTLAGDGMAGYKDGPAAAARFHSPGGLVVDAAGVVYVADISNNRIRKIAGGQVTTLAGSGHSGFLDGAASGAKFHKPHDVALAPSGATYVADHGNHRVRVIAAGMVSTFAGTGAAGYLDGSAKAARFKSPISVAAAGGVVFVGELKGRIRRISGGQVTTFAGTGVVGYKDGPLATAQFADPHSLFVAPGGELFVADQHNYVIRKIIGGVVSTVAGVGTKGFKDGPALSAQFSNLTGLAVSNGVIFVADEGNHRIRRIVP